MIVPKSGGDKQEEGREASSYLSLNIDQLTLLKPFQKMFRLSPLRFCECLPLQVAISRDGIEKRFYGTVLLESIRHNLFSSN